MLHVLVCAREKIVDTDDVRPHFNEALTQMGAQEPRSAGHQDTFFEMHLRTTRTSAEAIDAKDGFQPEAMNQKRWRAGRSQMGHVLVASSGPFR
jgi:hypothetical protein